MDPGRGEPLFVAERDEEVDVGVFRFDLHDGWMVHVVVVVVRDDDGVDGRDVLDLAWDLCVALGAHPAEGTTSLTEHGIKQDS